jgi:hypothetical protein
MSLEESGIKPRALEDKPTLSTLGRRYYYAFGVLSDGRPLGGMGGASPIPTIDIWAYAQLTQFSNPERLLRVVRTLDSLWLRHMSKKMESK